MTDRKKVKTVLSRLDQKSLALLADEFGIVSRDKNKSQLISSLLRMSLRNQDRMFRMSLRNQDRRFRMNFTQNGAGLYDEVQFEKIDDYITEITFDFLNKRTTDPIIARIKLDDKNINLAEFARTNQAIKKTVSKPTNKNTELRIELDPTSADDDDEIDANEIPLVVILTTFKNGAVAEIYRESIENFSAAKLLQALMNNHLYITDSAYKLIPLFQHKRADREDDEEDEEEPEEDDEEIEEVTQKMKRTRA